MAALMMSGMACLITGAASGIGRASAREFAREGAKVLVADTNVDGGMETVEFIEREGGTAAFVRCDISSESDVQEMVAQALSRYGQLNAAHLNAGIQAEQSLLCDSRSENWEQVIKVNLIGTYYCLKSTISTMLESGGGAVVVTSSMAGIEARRNQSSYIASKFAINGMVKGAALEYASQKVRVNAIAPGVTFTPGVAGFFTGRPDYEGALKEKIPTGAFTTVENQAKAAVWLCAPFNDQITGVILPIDSGVTAGKL
jgi:NAD(P)-dependent dehydrogenase (short-subunit alcohol dehydrogenase family)